MFLSLLQFFATKFLVLALHLESGSFPRPLSAREETDVYKRQVYESGALNAGLVIAISKSGKTGTILKPVQDSFAQHRSCLLYTSRCV